MHIEWNEQGYFQAMPRPTSQELQKYYRDNYVGRKLENSREYTDNELFNKTLGCKEAFNIAKKNSGKLFDIGCGEGFYLDFFKNRGWEVTGADFSLDGTRKYFPELLELVVEGDVFETIESQINENKKYDLVTLNNVLEHVLEPKEMINNIKKLLDTDGILKVSVPNDFSLFQTYLKENNYVDRDFWVCYPDHLNYFNIDGITKFLADNGFKIVDVLAGFPIEMFLMNEHSNYIQNSQRGKGAHYARTNIENLLTKHSLENLLAFRRGCAQAGIGRVVSLYCKL